MVLLSDAKLDEKTRADRFALIDAARKGKFTGVQLAITGLDNVATGTIYTAAEDGYFDAAGMHKWKGNADRLDDRRESLHRTGEPLLQDKLLVLGHVRGSDRTGAEEMMWVGL